MLYEVCDFLTDLADELQEVSRNDTFCKELALAASVLLKESASAIETYSISQDGAQLNRALITSSMSFLRKWEAWLNATGPNGFNHISAYIFHEFLLRFAKGMVKSWRIWRTDSVSK